MSGFMGNERAERFFIESGLDDAWRAPIRQDAHFMMNHVAINWSGAVASCIGAVRRNGVLGLASPVARGAARRAGLE